MKALSSERINPPQANTEMFQPSSLKSIITVLNLPSCRNIASTLLQYLNMQQIIAISQATHNSKTTNYFFQLIQNTHFINLYINKSDKSLYFSFYGEEEYKQIEITQIANITHTQSNIFPSYHSTLTHITQLLIQSLPPLKEQISSLINLLVDPDLPLPKLKRQTQGMFCSSPLQLFLVDCTFREGGDGEDEDFFCFEGLREFLSLEKEEEYLKQFMGIMKDKQSLGGELRKIMKIRYTPYQVNYKNLQDFLIPGNQLHNFIVGLFALTDVIVEATHTFISLITDPLHRLIQLLLRYSIFRNYVLAVQQYLSFTFKMYENIYHDTIQQDPKKPQYKFWRPALTKWFLRMNHLHSQGTDVYLHCLTKLRNKHICDNLIQLCNQDQQKYGKMLNNIELNHFEYNLAQKIFDGNYNTSSQIGLYFDTHPDNYQILVMEFNQYLIDISVNQQTVHWCGHSDHQLQAPYLIYEQKLLQLNNQYVYSIVGGLNQQDKHLLMKIDIEYLSILQIKNRTLKKLVIEINSNHQLIGEHQIIFDFDQADRKLEYFNNKALILSSVDNQERPFYSIPPLCSPEKLIDMLDTNSSENQNQEEENYQYNSEEEEEGEVFGAKGKKEQHFQDSSEEMSSSAQVKIQTDIGVGAAEGVLSKRSVVNVKKVFAQDYTQVSSPMVNLNVKGQHV